jgi:hypothetical protein
VGALVQTVSVEAAAPLLQTESGAVGNELDNKTVVNMPLLDRRSSQLQRLSGFVVPNGTGSNASFAIAGGRGNNANYLIDGGEAQNLLLGVPVLIFDPPVESVQEFNVAESNYAAELGRTGGGCYTDGRLRRVLTIFTDRFMSSSETTSEHQELLFSRAFRNSS